MLVSYFINNTENLSSSPQELIVSDIKDEQPATNSDTITQPSLDDLATEKTSVVQTSVTPDGATDDFIQLSKSETSETVDTAETTPAKNMSATAIDTEYNSIDEILNNSSTNPVLVTRSLKLHTVF